IASVFLIVAALSCVASLAAVAYFWAKQPLPGLRTTWMRFGPMAALGLGVIGAFIKTWNPLWLLGALGMGGYGAAMIVAQTPDRQGVWLVFAAPAAALLVLAMLIRCKDGVYWIGLGAGALLGVRLGYEFLLSRGGKTAATLIDDFDSAMRFVYFVQPV